MARKWWTLIAVSVATFMLLLDITVVNVALPSIRDDLGASFSDLQWVVDAYALTLAALVLTAGSLADRLGRRRLFAWGLGIFSAASLLCALAPDPTFLNVARALQGIGGAVMFAVSLALMAQEFPAGRERGTAMGIYGATIGVAVAIGPLVGGALTDALGWQSIFYLNVPIGLAAIGVTYCKLRESRDPNATRVDWAGVATFSAALFLLVLALVRGNDEGWGSTLIVSLFAGSAALLAAFLAIERRVARADAPARAVQAARVHRRAARGLRDLRLGLRAVPLPRRSTCRTTSATRRSRPGCATCRSRWRASSLSPVAAHAPLPRAGPGADERRPGGVGSRPAADVRDRRGLGVDDAARRLPGPRRGRRPPQPGDRGRRAQRGARRSGAAWRPASTTRSARSASRSASPSGARSSSARAPPR